MIIFVGKELNILFVVEASLAGMNLPVNKRYSSDALNRSFT